jgi:hypothetical protein
MNLRDFAFMMQELPAFSMFSSSALQTALKSWQMQQFLDGAHLESKLYSCPEDWSEEHNRSFLHCCEGAKLDFSRPTMNLYDWTCKIFRLMEGQKPLSLSVPYTVNKSMLNPVNKNWTQIFNRFRMLKALGTLVSTRGCLGILTVMGSVSLVGVPPH